jgi:hypothetical protein
MLVTSTPRASAITKDIAWAAVSFTSATIAFLSSRFNATINLLDLPKLQLRKILNHQGEFIPFLVWVHRLRRKAVIVLTLFQLIIPKGTYGL